MPVSFSTLLYSHCFDVLARPVVITPLASNPSGGAYSDMRAIFNSGPLTITNDEGIVIAVISDQETIIDIRFVEFLDAGHAVLLQGDLVHFEADTDIMGGDYEITDGPISNSGGQLTYNVRKWEPAAPLRSHSGWEIS